MRSAAREIVTPERGSPIVNSDLTTELSSPPALDASESAARQRARRLGLLLMAGSSVAVLTIAGSIWFITRNAL